MLTNICKVGRADLGRFARDALAFAKTCDDGRLTHRRLRLHGLDFEAAFADPAYADALTRVYAVDDTAGTPQRGLRVTVLDATLIPDMPRCVWSDSVIGGGPVRDALQVDGLMGVHDPDRDVWLFYDPETGEGVQLMPTPQTPPPWEASMPLRLFVHWAMHGISRPLIHAGTLGLGGDCVLLAGPGGAGKSGTTLGGILHGHASVGDDYVLAELADGEAITRPILKIMKQDSPGLRRLGLAPEASIFQGPNWQGKLEFEFARLCPSARVPAMRAKAILLPHISGETRTKARPASSKEAVLALAASSFAQLFGTWRADLVFLANLCRQLPAWRVDLGTDPAEVSSFIGGVIAKGHP